MFENDLLSKNQNRFKAIYITLLSLVFGYALLSFNKRDLNIITP